MRYYGMISTKKKVNEDKGYRLPNVNNKPDICILEDTMNSD